MSVARPVYKNACLMITKRVRNREYRLHPDEKTDAIIRYVVAVVAQRTGVRLSCIMVMSNHWHICLFDPEGRVCEFTRDCHAFIARAVNATHGDFEGFWSTEQTSHVACVEPGDFVAKIAYSMANPVEALLLEHGDEWPGVRMAWPAAPQTVTRPEKFFRGPEKGGEWPDTAVLVMSPPPGYDESSTEEVAALVNRAIEKREEAIRHPTALGNAFEGKDHCVDLVRIEVDAATPLRTRVALTFTGPATPGQFLCQQATTDRMRRGQGVVIVPALKHDGSRGGWPEWIPRPSQSSRDRAVSKILNS